MTVPFFYINLDRATDRKRFVEDQAARGGYAQALTRLAARDASAPETIAQSGYVPGAGPSSWTLTPTEIAVFESHRALWQRILDEGHACAVIMEDDIFTSRQMLGAVSSLTTATDGFDVIRLDSCAGAYRFGPARALGGQTLRPILQVVPSAACYLLSRAGAGLLLTGATRYSSHVDDYIFDPATGARAFQIWPAMAIQGMFSDAAPHGAPDPAFQAIAHSERTKPKAEQTAPDKGPALFRLRKEWTRFKSRLSRRLGGDRGLCAAGGVIGSPPLADDLPGYRQD